MLAALPGDLPARLPAATPAAVMLVVVAVLETVMGAMMAVLEPAVNPAMLAAADAVPVDAGMLVFEPVVAAVVPPFEPVVLAAVAVVMRCRRRGDADGEDRGGDGKSDFHLCDSLRVMREKLRRPD